jgi:hypothetical protein
MLSVRQLYSLLMRGQREYYLGWWQSKFLHNTEDRIEAIITGHQNNHFKVTIEKVDDLVKEVTNG